MNAPYITSKMNEYLFRLTDRMSNWLSNKLPKLNTNWWEDLVLGALSPIQRENIIQKKITKMDELDLAALLRVVDRNWFVITSVFYVNNKNRYHVKSMMEIRNTWAHISPSQITKQRILHDVDIVVELMQAFDAKMSDTRDMEEFIMDVEDDKDFSNVSIPSKTVVPEVLSQDANLKENEITIGSLVTLTSDNTVFGAVIGIIGDKYSVLIGNAIQSFYKEQIQLKVDTVFDKHLAISRVKSALTAYQINNPGSSNLYSLNSARIDFVPYQFRPALKMIKSDIPRLLVADDVGVGKTIEAGLILKEMEARSNMNSVLIICPRPLVAERKWELEMKRFDENFTQLDGKGLSEAISEAARDSAWPEQHSKTIIPYSLFGEDTIEGTNAHTDKKHKSVGLAQLDPLPHFDLVIVDEAHNIRNQNTWAYKGVELLTRNADAVIFLTATPLQNSNNDLYTLLNLLRPDLIVDRDTFKTMAEPNGYINSLMRIIRDQEDDWAIKAKDELTNILSTVWGRNVVQHNPNFAKIFELVEKGTISRDEKVEAIGLIESLHSFNSLITRTRRRDIEDFCIRRTQTVNVPFASVQKSLYDALIEFESKSLAMLHGSRSVRFMMCTIMRQASSCIYGLAPFLKDIVSRRLEQIGEDGELYEYDCSLDTEEEKTISVLAHEIDSLAKSLNSDDPKIEKLYEIIEQKQKEDNNRVIIFSSFRHTLSYIRKNLESKGYRVAQVDGGVADEERYHIRERFLLDRNDKNAVDVLLFSEVGCEGLDYQFCDTMINYDLPWNPMRIEQRIGRIDRRGQKSSTVKIYNMITNDTIDAVIYDRCLNKIGVFEASIGDCSEILGDISEQIFRIMFTPDLSEDERKQKIEQMADNEIRKVQEMHQLEQDEKALYGFDLTGYIHSKDVQEAENSWITSQSINDMVETFVSDMFGEGEYIRGKSELKTLRLSRENRQALLEDLKKLKISNNNNATKMWNAYLRSDKPIIPITFDPSCAKDNREVAFLTQMHPLVLQAAHKESQQFPCEIGITVANEGIKPGEYEFLIYAWKYVGLKPDIKLIAVSDNEIIQNNILSFLQFAEDFDYSNVAHIAKWDAMDSLHYSKWQTSTDEYKKQVKDECDYRIEQLRQNTSKREGILRGQLDTASDEKIIRMRKSQLEKLSGDFETQSKSLENMVSKADIHTQLLVKGVINIV